MSISSNRLKRTRKIIPTVPPIPPFYNQISWSGYTWNVRPVVTMGPGPNHWSNSSRNVSVNANGQLSLSITNDNETWNCIEVVGPHLGYGSYEFVLATNPTPFDPKLVLGFFTYDDTDDGSNAYREIDIEVSLWNASNEQSRIWYTVQPSNEFSISDTNVTTNTPYTCKFVWQPGQVYFASYDQTGVLLGEHFVTKGVPAPGNETIRFNFWLIEGQAPLNRQDATCLIDSFKYTADVTTQIKAANLQISTFELGPDGIVAKNGATFQNGKLYLNCTPAYSAAYSGVAYNIIESMIDIKVAAIPTLGNGTREACWYVRYDASHYAGMLLSGDRVYCRLMQNGIKTESSFAYNPELHVYWRIRETSGMIYFETSTDYATWLIAWQSIHTLADKLAQARIRFDCGYYGTETNPEPFIIEAINHA